MKQPTSSEIKNDYEIYIKYIRIYGVFDTQRKKSYPN
jgi:hypothetical protein